MKKLFILFLLCINANVFGRTENVVNEKIQVLAKFISNEGGDKIWRIKYKVLKNFSSQPISEIITVGFYNYKTFKENQDTVLLTLENYPLQKIKNYYIFPEYNAEKNTEKVKVNYISKEYFENCEIGKECKEINLKKETERQKWFLILPCGGTFSSVYLRKKEEEKPIMETSTKHENCPPILELNELKDGKYFVNMISCGLGGKVELNIKTKK